MRAIAYILALVLIHSQVHAGYIINPYIFGTTSSPSYLLYQDWGGTTIPSGMTTTGGSPDYSVDGKVSLDFGDKVICDTFTAQSTAYFAFTIEFDAVGNAAGTRFLRLNDSSSAILGNLQLSTGDKLVYTHGTGSTYGTTDIVAATKYYAWASYTDTGDYTLRLGTTGTYASSTLEISGSDGTSTDDLAQLELSQIFSDTGGDVHFELTAVDDEAIGDI